MKKTILYIIPCLLVVLLLSLSAGIRRPASQWQTLDSGDGREALGDAVSLSCSPLSAGYYNILPDPTGRFVPALPGWGHYHFPVTTGSDSTQFYVDQGLNLYYGYQLREAIASFKEAARHDSNCVMAYWGQALSMGPYYNNSYGYKMPITVLSVLAKMNGLIAHGTKREQDLVKVINLKYSADSSDSRRKALNEAYSEATFALIGKYPTDLDIKMLYVDGVMTEHAWDMWDDKGNAKPWTPELIRYCYDVLAKDPQHPAALHYQIHLVEASLHPELALQSADVLAALMPGVAHMVHMASHMYERNGLYAKGVEVNDRANAAQHYYDSFARQLNLGSDIYHYDAVQTFCALSGGMYRQGLKSANRVRMIVTKDTNSLRTRTYRQYLYMMPMFTLVRLGKWQELLDMAAPPAKLSNASLLSDFGRGLAFLRLGNLNAAQACLDSMRTTPKDSILYSEIKPFNAAIKMLNVAENILSAELLFAHKKYPEAMDSFRLAIVLEGKLLYSEPKEWPLSVRHFAGLCLLKLNKPAEAEKMYREDLVLDPVNGWALIGMYQSLSAQHKKEAMAYKESYTKAFASAEEIPPASAY